MICLFTIPHTGTSLVLQDILGHHKLIRNPKRGHGVNLRHVYPKNLREIVQRLDEGYPLIVPMRPPLRCAVSWKARDKDLGYCKALWEIMVEVIHPYNPAYIPIQEPNRDYFLELAGERIGEDLVTQWPVVASSGRSAELTHSEVDMFREFAPYYDQLSSA